MLVLQEMLGLEAMRARAVNELQRLEHTAESECACADAGAGTAKPRRAAIIARRMASAARVGQTTARAPRATAVPHAVPHRRRRITARAALRSFPPPHDARSLSVRHAPTLCFARRGSSAKRQAPRAPPRAAPRAARAAYSAAPHYTARAAHRAPHAAYSPRWWDNHTPWKLISC